MRTKLLYGSYLERVSHVPFEEMFDRGCRRGRGWRCARRGHVQMGEQPGRPGITRTRHHHQIPQHITQRGPPAGPRRRARPTAVVRADDARARAVIAAQVRQLRVQGGHHALRDAAENRPRRRQRVRGDRDRRVDVPENAQRTGRQSGAAARHGRHDRHRLAEGNRRAGRRDCAGERGGPVFPDTYLFDKGTSDIAVYKRAYKLMQQRLAEAWATRAQNLPYKTAYEALIMASIVEKETGRAADRPLVAAVFANRLRIGMPLQTDPSVIYGLGSAYGGRLRKKDLQTDTPYNTYTRMGLPPGPIALPGVAALAATVNPASSTALYFVSRGDGSSFFSDNLGDHNRAVDKYIRGQ